jgi:polysaccharide export outer membrane protein
MYRMFLFALCSVLVVSCLMGCVSKGVPGDEPDLIGEAAAEGAESSAPASPPPRPALSVSTTRTVTPQSIDGVQPAPAAEQPESSDNQMAATETGVTFYRLKVGDPVVINLRGIYPRDEVVEDIVDEEGNITIPLIGDIPAIGKSTSQLESEVRRLYIDGGYYRTITVSAVVPQRTYFIRGEIRGPGRFPIVSGVTLMQAIAAAGGYTEFANQRSVKLIRGGTTTTINMRDIDRNPERDIRLESGDIIVVDRSIL